MNLVDRVQFALIADVGIRLRLRVLLLLLLMVKKESMRGWRDGGRRGGLMRGRLARLMRRGLLLLLLLLLLRIEVVEMGLMVGYMAESQ